MEDDLIRVVDTMAVDNVDIEVARGILSNIGMTELDVARAVLNGMYKDMVPSDNMFYDTVIGEYGAYNTQEEMLIYLDKFVNKYGISRELNVTANGVPRDVIINDMILTKRNPVNIGLENGVIIGEKEISAPISEMLTMEVQDVIENMDTGEEMYVIEDGHICDVELILG